MSRACSACSLRVRKSRRRCVFCYECCEPVLSLAYLGTYPTAALPDAGYLSGGPPVPGIYTGPRPAAPRWLGRRRRPWENKIEQQQNRLQAMCYRDDDAPDCRAVPCSFVGKVGAQPSGRRSLPSSVVLHYLPADHGHASQRFARPSAPRGRRRRHGRTVSPSRHVRRDAT